MSIVSRYVVVGMTCEHCVLSVSEALSAIAGVDRADVDLESGTASVQWATAADDGAVRAAVEDVGYDLHADA